jgi:glycosyltransferase involved in cell wall biosynthesis
MNLLFFSSMGGSPWGGSEELWLRAALAARAAGHAVAFSVFDFGTSVPQLAPLTGTTEIPRPRRPSFADRLLRRTPWLAAIERFRPDAVCVSQGSAYELVGRRSTRPFADWLVRTGTPFVNVVQFNEPKSDLRPAIRVASRRLHDAATVNGFVAARNIEEAAVTLGAPVPHARVVRNPVNLTDTSPLPFPPLAQGLRLACVARLHVDAKGQDMLLDALASRPWRDDAWSLSLFGRGQDEQRLRDQTARLGLASKVRFMGQTDDLRAVWAEHHMLVLPSRAEGTPLAMVEAMLLGRPCLVTDVGGCADWITDTTNGFLTAPTTVGLSEALDRVWAARERSPVLAAEARATAFRLHDPDPGTTLLNLMLAGRPQHPVWKAVK